MPSDGRTRAPTRGRQNSRGQYDKAEHKEVKKELGADRERRRPYKIRASSRSPEVKTSRSLTVPKDEADNRPHSCPPAADARSDQVDDARPELSRYERVRLAAAVPPKDAPSSSHNDDKPTCSVRLDFIAENEANRVRAYLLSANSYGRNVQEWAVPWNVTMDELKARAFADIYLHPYYRHTKDGYLRRRIDVYNNPNTRGWTPEGSFLLLAFKVLQNSSTLFTQYWEQSSVARSTGNDPKRHEYRVVQDWVCWAIPNFPYGDRAGGFYLNEILARGNEAYIPKLDIEENLGSPIWRQRYAPNLTPFAWPNVEAMKKAYGDAREVMPINLSAMTCSDIAREEAATPPGSPGGGQGRSKRQKGEAPSSSGSSGSSSQPDDSGQQPLMDAIGHLLSTAKTLCSSWEYNTQAARAATEAEKRCAVNIQDTRAAIETLQSQATAMEEDANLVKEAKDKAIAAADNQAATVNSLKEKIRELAKSLPDDEESKIGLALSKIRAVSSAKR